MMYSPPPPYMAMFPQPVSYVPGPIGIHGLFAPPPPAYQISFAPLQQVAIPPPPPPYQPAEKEDKKPAEKEDKKPSIKKEDVKKLPPKKENDKKEGDEKLVFNCFEPPEILPGANYMFPQEHVTMHIFKTAAKVWEPKYKKRMLQVTHALYTHHKLLTMRQGVQNVPCRHPGLGQVSHRARDE